MRTRWFGWVLLAFLTMVSESASADDHDFSRLVKVIESRYRTHRDHIPLWGFVKPVLKTARPLGANGLEIAVFEDLNLDRSGSPEELAVLVQGALNSSWRPMLCVCSKRDGERTLIYANAIGKKLRLMILTMDGDGAVVLEARFKPDNLGKWLQDPMRIREWARQRNHSDLEE